WVLTANRFKVKTEQNVAVVLRKGTGGHVIVGNQFIPAGMTHDYFISSAAGVDLAANFIHSNIGGRAYDMDGNATQIDVHTIVTKASGGFTPDELKLGRIGYRQDTNELVLNIGGSLRKINTQPA